MAVSWLKPAIWSRINWSIWFGGLYGYGLDGVGLGVYLGVYLFGVYCDGVGDGDTTGTDGVGVGVVGGVAGCGWATGG